MSHWVSDHHKNADAYAGSALPFASGSIAVTDGVGWQIKFPYVTRFIQVFNNHASNGLRVGFTENAVEETNSSNFFVVPPNTASARLEVKCMEVWLAGDSAASTASLIAGYTAVPENRFVVGALSGSNGFKGVG